MGAHHKEESRVEEDGLWALLYGTTKIASGAAGVGLIIAYSKPSESDVNAFYATQCEPFYLRPVGFEHCVASGLQAQRYILDHHRSVEDLARLVVRRWKDAEAGGRVLMGRPPTEREVVESENAASPLTRLMMSQPVDGAVAVLIASEDIARRAGQRPIWITGLGASADRHSYAMRKPGVLEACAAAAASAFKRAGWTDVGPDIAEVSASSAVGELMVLEAMTLASAGRGVDLLDSDKCAINRSGGALPADPIMATGLVRLSEAARQLAYPSSYGLKSPRSAVVHGAGGVGMQTHCVVTLEA
jgi:acetyl-CoA C-acetyltransferase